MKTKSLFIAALFIAGAIVTAVGKEAPSNTGLVVVPVKGSEVFKVIYRSEVMGRVKLNIYNAQSSLIFTESFSRVDGFIRPLNFRGLDSGEYTVELIDASGKRSEKVNYQPYKSNKSVHISKVVNAEGKYLVTVANGADEVINVKIFDRQNNLLHSETRELKGDFAQLYTVKNASGVTIEISDRAGNVQTGRF